MLEKTAVRNFIGEFRVCMCARACVRAGACTTVSVIIMFLSSGLNKILLSVRRLHLIKLLETVSATMILIFITPDEFLCFSSNSDKRMFCIL
jgi:hypothetical protein